MRGVYKNNDVIMLRDTGKETNSKGSGRGGGVEKVQNNARGGRGGEGKAMGWIILNTSSRMFKWSDGS